MTPRSFWMILLKIIGIYIILNSLYVIVQFINSSLYIVGSNDSSAFMQMILGIIIIPGLYYLVFRYFVQKTEFIIDRFKLDQGFIEEKFEIKTHRSTILQIVIIVLGAVMVTDALPLFCRQLFLSFQQEEKFNGFKNNPISSWTVYYLVKLLIGLFMMTTSRLVVNFIERKRRETPTIVQQDEQ